MGVSSSKMDDDKALLLCRERKRIVKQALDGRCSLAVAHVAYFQALKNTGMALGKLVEPAVSFEPSFHTSTFASQTPKPLALTDKPYSKFLILSPSMSPHTQSVERVSPPHANSSSFNVSYMKSEMKYSETIEVAPPISVTASLQPPSDTSTKSLSQKDDISNLNTTPEEHPWDYFDLFHPPDDRFSFQDGQERKLDHVSENVGDIKRLREEEGIPELENEEEKASLKSESEKIDSEDDFNQPSSEPLVRIFKHRSDMLDAHSNKTSSDESSVNDLSMVSKLTKEDATPTVNTGPDEGAPDLTKTGPSTTSNNEKGDAKAFVSENKLAAKDFSTSMKDIQEFFDKASESSKEVRRMLEADKIKFHPLLHQDQGHTAHNSEVFNFFSTIFACCGDEVYNNEEPTSSEIKYLTWHQSPSITSSLNNPAGTTSRDGVEDVNGDLFGGMCMSSGSHASTLDRLYAWERKLYDEVKASGIVRNEFDMKCKLLRQLESKGENVTKIDKTRAQVKDLYSRIRVAIHRIDSISKTIEELRDKEIQPQLEELIGGLSRMWEKMLQCHKHQLCIISVSTNMGGSRMLSLSESNQEAAVVLNHELNLLHSSFLKWISTLKSYLQSINEWLLKCVFPLQRKSSRRRNVQFSPRRDFAPPIYVACRDWLAGLDKLPSKEVGDAIKDLILEITHFMPRQEKKHGDPNLSLSLLQTSERNGELAGNMVSNGAPVNFNLACDGLRCRLEVLLNRLTVFSDKSVKMYAELSDAINSARVRYENAGRKV